MEKLINYIGNYIEIDEKLNTAILDSFKEDSFKKGDHLLMTEHYCQKLYFITSGAVRTYYLQDGRDVTSWVYPEDSMVTNWSSFITGILSYENIQAISAVKVFSISYDALQDLYSRFTAMESFGRILMEEQIAFIDELTHEFNFATAKERYDKLLTMYPDLTRWANLGYIASILGITQETLSRIRKLK